MLTAIFAVVFLIGCGTIGWNVGRAIAYAIQWAVTMYERKYEDGGAS